MANTPLSERIARIRALTSRADRYSDGEPIDRGGMGKIDRVRDLQLGRYVARKSILPEFVEAHGDAALHRFLDEAEVVAQLSHQGVIPIHDVGVDDAGPFLIMRWVRGRDLEELLWRREEEWTQARMIEVLIKVCDTMAHAHSRGVVHRDLKPSNIMVGTFGEVYVIDWGLAKVEGDDRVAFDVLEDNSRVRVSRPESAGLTVHGRAIGSPGYMAPEQSAGRHDDVGPHSDVYSAGSILYRMLTGWQPYTRPGEPPDAVRVMARLLEGDPAPILDLCADANPRLVTICERAMSRDVAARYPSALELSDDLRAAMGAQLQRGKSWWRRLFSPAAKQQVGRPQGVDPIRRRPWRQTPPGPVSGSEGEPRLSAGESERHRLERRLRGLDRLSAESSRYQSARPLRQAAGATVVERVHDVVLDRDVARKTLRLDRVVSALPDRDARQSLVAQLSRRFLDEAQITAQLNHPAILPIHELGIDAQGQPFAILPLVESDPEYSARIRAGEPLEFDRTLRIVLAIADALAYAHERGVVHMNVNPGNILVASGSEVYLADWHESRVHGVDDMTASPQTKSVVELFESENLAAGPGSTSPPAEEGELVAGNLWFMSPERLLATGAYGPWTDVFQLGATLFYLLCGRAPCDFRNDMRTAKRNVVQDWQYWMRRVDAFRMGPPALPPGIWHAVPEPVRQILSCSMMFDPEDRYPDCAFMAHDLRWYLGRFSDERARVGAN